MSQHEHLASLASGKMVLLRCLLFQTRNPWLQLTPTKKGDVLFRGVSDPTAAVQ